MKPFDSIIIGGSYAGLAAAMALGRALKNVLIMDDGKACNRQTPYSHNYLTNDGKSPEEIASIAHLQVKRYTTIHFFNGSAKKVIRTGSCFELESSTGERFASKKIIFATGIRDLMPDIAGLAACWGISVLHCPYCHGYEVRNEKTGILGNGEPGFDFTRLISNWTNDLTLLTNGTSTLTVEQHEHLEKHHIQVVEKEIGRLEQMAGYLQHVIFKDGTRSGMKALYAPSPFEQHCKIPAALGCQLTEDGYIQVNSFQETTAEGVYACGDNASRIRTVANAVASGTTAGIALSKKMILEEF